MSIGDNVARVREKIESACRRSARSPASVTLVAVSKTFPPEAIEEAIAAGITDVGENRVQEAREKRPSVQGRPRWHLVGHLQSNKAKEAVALFDVIQAVDSSRLGEKLAREAEAAGRGLEVLLQVNVGREPQKHGFGPEELEVAAMELAKVIPLCGLMTIPPVAGAEDTRNYFRVMRELFDRLQTRLGDSRFNQLSMGMSHDFELAIEEGATVVRVGRAIFGERA